MGDNATLMYLICDFGSEAGGTPRDISVNNEDFWNAARLLEDFMFLLFKKPCRYAQSIGVNILMDFKKKILKIR